MISKRHEMKIAVVCAYYAHHMNTGMITVDLGAQHFLRKVFAGFQIDFYSYIEAFDVKDGISYQYYEEPNLLLDQYDYLLFWGDFLHSFDYFCYGSGLHALTQKKLGLNARDAEDHLYKTLLLESVDVEKLKKVICIGGALHLNGNYTERCSRYNYNIARLYSECKMYSCRDPFSHKIADSYSSNNNGIVGLDGAFHLNPEELLESYSENLKDLCLDASNFNIGFSFNRSVRGNEEARLGVMQLIEGIMDNLSSSSRGVKYDIEWFKGVKEKPVEEVAKKIACIRRCSVVVTDTYHLAVNALNCNVPVVLVGYGADRIGHTLNEKKKEWLLRCFNMSEMYVYLEELASREKTLEIANSLYGRIKDHGYNASWISSLSSSKFSFESKVKGVLGLGAEASGVELLVSAPRRIDGPQELQFGKMLFTTFEVNFDISNPSGKDIPKGVVLSLALSDESKERELSIPHFQFSGNQTVGYYRYVRLPKGRSYNKVIVELPAGVCCYGIRVLPWASKKSSILHASVKF